MLLLLKLLGTGILILLFLLPIFYGVNGFQSLGSSLGLGLAVGIVIGLALGLGMYIGGTDGDILGRARPMQFLEPLTLGMAFGLFLGLVWGIAWDLLGGAYGGLGAGFTTGFVWALFVGLIAGYSTFRQVHLPLKFGETLVNGLIFGILADLFTVLSGWIEAGPATGIVTGLGAAVGGLLGGIIGLNLAPGLRVYTQLWPYLRGMAVSIIGFAYGYFSLVLIFAGWFATVYRWDTTAFVGLGSDWAFKDFLFFSMMTITTQGYSDIKPLSPLAQFLVALETVAGLAWTIIVFAALLAYLDPRLTAITNARSSGDQG